MCLLAIYISSFRRRQWHPTPVLLPGESHGWRSLVGCSPWDPEELDTIEWLYFHFSLSCIGEGNGNPLQCSCLENPRDGGAWWAAVSGIAQSRTRLKRLSSSSMSSLEKCLFSSLTHLLIGLFIFLVLSCMSCLYILEINPLSVVLFATLPFWGLFFNLVYCFLCCAKAFKFN